MGPSVGFHYLAADIDHQVQKRARVPSPPTVRDSKGIEQSIAALVRELSGPSRAEKTDRSDFDPDLAGCSEGLQDFETRTNEIHEVAQDAAEVEFSVFQSIRVVRPDLARFPKPLGRGPGLAAVARKRVAEYSVGVETTVGGCVRPDRPQGRCPPVSLIGMDGGGFGIAVC